MAIFAGTVAAVANITVSYRTADSAERLERLKWDQGRIEAKRKDLAEKTAALASLLMKTLAVHNAAPHRLVLDREMPSNAHAKLDIRRYESWESQEYVDATYAIDKA